MADSSFRRELVRAALPAAIDVCVRNSIDYMPDAKLGTPTPEQLAEYAADLAVLIAKKTDEAYTSLVAAERAIDTLAGGVPSGALVAYVCKQCGHLFSITGDFPSDKFCPQCGATGEHVKKLP